MKMVDWAIAGCTTSNATAQELATLGQQAGQLKKIKFLTNGKKKVKNNAL
jgi:hypothetical protein